MAAVAVRAVRLWYAKIPSSHFQPNATLLHPDRRVRAAQLYISNVADFKGVPAGLHFGDGHDLSPLH
jgi:hypothetical protein